MNSHPVTQLIEIQERDKLSDGQMAKRLGCSRPLWNLTKHGKATLGTTMIQCIFRNFPELHTSLALFLSQGADRLTEPVSKAD